MSEERLDLCRSQSDRGDHLAAIGTVVRRRRQLLHLHWSVAIGRVIQLSLLDEVDNVATKVVVDVELVGRHRSQIGVVDLHSCCDEMLLMHLHSRSSTCRSALTTASAARGRGCGGEPPPELADIKPEAQVFVAVVAPQVLSEHASQAGLLEDSAQAIGRRL